MKRSTKVILSGAALFFAALWGGFYLYDLADGTWAEMPTGISAVIFAVAGIAVCAIGIIAHDAIDKEDRP